MAFIRLVPTGADVDSRFTWSASDGAILHLPGGASRLNCFSDLFRYHAITHAYSWYKFANINLHRRVPNGSLYLITGTDKTSSWMVGAFSGAPPGDQVSLHFSIAGNFNGVTSYTYSWATMSAPVHCTGPRKDEVDQLSQDDLDAIGRDDAVFQGDAPGGQDQCAFLRGYRIMLNRTITDSGEVQSDAEVLSITDASPGDVTATISYIPFTGNSKSNMGRGRGGGGGSGSDHRSIVTSEDSEKDKTSDNLRDYEVMLESIPEHAEVSVSMMFYARPYCVSQAISSINSHQQISLGIGQSQVRFSL